MILRVAGGTVLGAMVLMVWGYAYWDLLLPPGSALLDAADQPALAAALRSRLPTAGTYFIPHDSEQGDEAPGHGDPHAALVEQVEGTIAMIHYLPEGGNPLSPRTYIQSFVHFLATTLLASLLLTWVSPALGGYRQRAAFVFAVAVFAIFAIRFTDPIWYRLPWAYFLYVALYLVSGWFVAALLIAAVVRPRR